MKEYSPQQKARRNQNTKDWRKKNRDRYNTYCRVISWRKNPYRVWIIATTVDRVRTKITLHTPRKVDDMMRKWISEDEIHEVVIECARRNEWLKRPTLE